MGKGKVIGGQSRGTATLAGWASGSRRPTVSVRAASAARPLVPRGPPPVRTTPLPWAWGQRSDVSLGASSKDALSAPRPSSLPGSSPRNSRPEAPVLGAPGLPTRVEALRWSWGRNWQCDPKSSKERCLLTLWARNQIDSPRPLHPSTPPPSLLLLPSFPPLLVGSRPFPRPTARRMTDLVFT